MNQPPSGGCVLKLGLVLLGVVACHPAAFGRLCVETYDLVFSYLTKRPSRLRAAVC